MKKLLALCLALALLLSVSALAEETVTITPADVIGTWYVTAYGMGGQVYSVADLGLDTTMYIIISEDGTGFIKDETSGSSAAAAWEISGSSLNLGEDMPLTMKDGQLLFADEENNAVMYFTLGEAKEPIRRVQPSELPWADPAGDAELDITGHWTLNYVGIEDSIYRASDLDVNTMNLEFYTDGTMTISYEDSSGNAEWTREDNVIFIHASDGDGQFIIENGNIIYQESTVKMILTR